MSLAALRACADWAAMTLENGVEPLPREIGSAPGRGGILSPFETFMDTLLRNAASQSANFGFFDLA